ncbi:MAG: hypothetical protein WBC76_02120 [Actinomycetes bacterium]|jgi:hypothetical protein
MSASEGATHEGLPHALERGRAVVTIPQPVRFKLKHANMGASDLD